MAFEDETRKPDVISVNEINEPLPFSDRKQTAILGHLLTNGKFFSQVHSKIKEGWFADPMVSLIWKARLDFQQIYKRLPLSLAEFEESEYTLARIENSNRIRCIAKLQECLVVKEEFGLDALRSEMTLWFKSRVFKAWMEKLPQEYNAGAQHAHKLLSAVNSVKKFSNEIEDATMDETKEMRFDDVANGSFFEQKKARLENACTFGCPVLDKHLLPDCISGGSLLRGDHTVVLAPTNSGKTSCLVTIAQNNLLLGKSVLFITHEGSPESIKSKILQSIEGKTETEIMDMTITPQGQKKLEVLTAKLSRDFVYLPLNKPGLTVEEVAVAIKMVWDRRLAKKGFGFDLIIDDYPAKLMTDQAKGGNLQKRHIDETIYNYFTQMALDYDCHVVTAIQTNREGSKVNKHRQGAGGRRLLTMEDVAESWGAMTTATNVITINRDEDAEANKRLTYHIAKSRTNDTGWSIVTRTRYDICRTHGEELPATYYRGTGTLDDKIDMLLEQHPNQSIPKQWYDL